MLTFQLTSTAILILSLINTAKAHYVWLEREGEGPAYAYFGEWVDDIREKAGVCWTELSHPVHFSAPALVLCLSNGMKTN